MPASPDPIVILISFDGWRWDYIDRLPVPNVRALAARGIRAERLIPSFPSLTFPNHYTIVTGLRPARHGIVANDIVEPETGDRFSNSTAVSRDPRWWGGEPLWITAIRQGRRAASVFWPGTEVEIDGARPTHWLPYDGTMPNEARVERLLSWLDRPEEERSAFLTLYFEEVDTIGHDFGPLSPELERAAARLDAALGQLVDGVRRRGLDARVHYVLTSDHGMAELSFERLLLLDDLIDVGRVDVIYSGALLLLAPLKGSALDLQRALDGRHPALRVYLSENLPARLEYRGHPNIAPVVGLVDDGWTVTTRAEHEQRLRDRTGRAGGAHGYDPEFVSMSGLFVAAGPRLRQGMVVATLDNIHVYEFVCALLGLEPAANEGRAEATRAFFQESRSTGWTRESDPILVTAGASE